ncbi:hypothetical protein VF_0150 [Aliivibrio fischeri ES114]|uniref:Glycosyltransferase 52 family protein n=2 Tax=Aliivibrio fischeri TaxID=668 RepID=Q5E8K1_ALIF1|nr:hypothetical protein VF_0150 [Aliivibrio fischeri ES114]KLU78903.1 hypothetical protein AB192_09725 [Aliivibrio fischeri]
MNVFLVTSPFQYICAIEAKFHYKSKNNILILIEQNSHIGKKQMSSLIKNEDWDYIFTFPRSNRTFITPKIIKKIKQISSNKLDTLFYSEYNAWRSKLIIKNLDFQKHVFFDDGTMTYFDYYDYIEPKASFYRPRFLQDIQLRLQGITPISKLDFFDNTEIFSIFEFKNCVITYTENKLNVLKKRINRLNNTSQFEYDVFIGQGSVDEKNRISLKEYITLIKSVLSESKSYLIYIPHRTEATHVTESIKKINGVIFHQPNYPIEVELVENNITPLTITGLSSTALYTLSKIYPNSKIKLVDQQSISKGERDKRIQLYLNEYFDKIK